MTDKANGDTPSEYEAMFGDSTPEPEAPAAPEPETEAEAAAVEPDGADDGAPETAEEPERKQKTVPHQALHAERVKSRELNRELQEARERMARLEERMAMIFNRGGDAEKKAPEVPDPEADPIAAMRWTQDQLRAISEREQRDRQQREQAGAQEQEFQRAYARVAEDYKAAVAEDPGIVDAYEHFRGSRVRELVAYGIPEMQAYQALENEERQIIMDAARTGRPITDYIERIATARGWSRKSAGAGKDARIDTIEAGVKSSKSLSTAAGGAVRQTVTLADVEKMSDEEFAAALAKHGDAWWRRLNGA